MTDTADKLARTLQDALALLRDAAYAAPAPRDDGTEHGTLLQQCLALCEQQQSQRPEPVRTLHQFACTGGTVISKCVAAMPNVQLLSEVDPLSQHLLTTGKPKFAPTDMVTLLRQSTRGASQQLLIDLFQTELHTVHADASRLALRLVIRDHAHSHFCHGSVVPERPAFRALIPSTLPLRSLVTVRHPVDSYASLTARGWVHFTPGTLDEYCRRYLLFLDLYDGVPVVRYEDFVAEPLDTMRTVCGHLELAFSPDFPDLFSVFHITGDSGRKGDRIEKRPERALAAQLQDEALASEHYLKLVARLGYAARRAGPGA